MKRNILKKQKRLYKYICNIFKISNEHATERGYHAYIYIFLIFC